MSESLVKPAEAYKLCGGISESTARRWIAAVDFPKPIVLNRDRHGKPVRIAFIRSELEDWIQQKIALGRGRIG